MLQLHFEKQYIATYNNDNMKWCKMGLYETKMGLNETMGLYESSGGCYEIMELNKQMNICGLQRYHGIITTRYASSKDENTFCAAGV